MSVLNNRSSEKMSGEDEKKALNGGDREMELKNHNSGTLPPPSYDATVNSDLPNDITRRTLRGPLAPINNFINACESSSVQFYKEHKTVFNVILLTILLTGYIAYFVVAVKLDAKRALNLIYITAFAFFCIAYWFVKKFFGKQIWNGLLEPIHDGVMSRWKIFKWAGILIFVAFVIFWICWDTIKKPERLISMAGLVIYVLLGFLFSKHRDQIKWRPVMWGFALQFIFGLLILRTNPGYEFFKWLGDLAATFLNFAKAGSEFVFDKNNAYNHYFAFIVLPVIVYFSSITYLLYYLGWIQIVIKKIAWLLQVTMGTSPAESVNAAGNIFVGQTEAPLLIRPFLSEMTESELHCVMTGGFATIAGSVLGAYISFGVPASHLLSASVMSAPAALAMSKLMYPETEEPQWSDVDDIEIESTEERNVFEAIAVGASMSITLVANIVVMLIAFLSLLKFANEVLGWLGWNVGVEGFSFEFICSYVFMPFAYVMGVKWKDSFEVAKLLGTKTFLNEFLAYEGLAELIKNRIQKRGGPIMDIRSEVITTYALCGFANFGSMGVQLGGISALVPHRQQALARVVFRALVAGTMACFMTACVAGMLFDPARYDSNVTPAPTLLNTTIILTTLPN